MNKSNFKIKLTFVRGLRDIVVNEIKKKTVFNIIDAKNEEVYVNFIENYDDILKLRSISSASIVFADRQLNPAYISKHKSILGTLVDEVLGRKPKIFKTFKISCAGADSPEVRDINQYIELEYKLIQNTEADLKINIAKVGSIWEISAQITPRPLSVRDYKIRNMSGAMDPTIAYALNSLCEIENRKTYLNIFSGSATLLIEAGLSFENLDRLVGFDNDKTNLSMAYKNVAQAGLIKKIQLYEKDIFSLPQIGKFDVVVADLPFGMAISKNENLDKLYRVFIDYSAQTLVTGGTLGVYTSEVKIFQRALDDSGFKIINRLKLKIITNTGAYLYPEIFICKRK